MYNLIIKKHVLYSRSDEWALAQLERHGVAAAF